jgi:hypothetical protein
MGPVLGLIFIIIDKKKRASLYGGSLRFTASLLYTVGFIFLLPAGGVLLHLCITLNGISFI